jgi:hypothetical protein
LGERLLLADVILAIVSFDPSIDRVESVRRREP